MKLSCSSRAFGAAIERGDLTQLEFLDLCARELACDGVVLDVRHFPRTDDDYLAQIKKMAADLGLDIAAIATDDFFGAGDESMRENLQQAIALGAPLLAAPLASETERSWSEQLDRLSAATGFAKRANVTLALRNVPGTHAGAVHDCKRVSKEADSAWLRYGLDPSAFERTDDPDALTPKLVLLWTNVGDDAASRIAQFPAFRGHVVLDARSEDATKEEMQNAMRSWRTAFCDVVLNRK